MGADLLRDRRRHHAGREDRGRNEDPRAELEITVRDAEPPTSMRPGTSVPTFRISEFEALVAAR